MNKTKYEEKDRRGGRHLPCGVSEGDRGLENVVVIVRRWFGGTKLGTTNCFETIKEMAKRATNHFEQ